MNNTTSSVPARFHCGLMGETIDAICRAGNRGSSPARVHGLGALERKSPSARFIGDRSGWVKPALSNATKSSSVISPNVFSFSGLSQFSMVNSERLVVMPLEEQGVGEVLRG